MQHTVFFNADVASSVSNTFSEQGHEPDLIFSGQGHEPDLIFSGQGHEPDLIFSEQGHEPDLIFSEQGHEPDLILVSVYINTKTTFLCNFQITSLQLNKEKVFIADSFSLFPN